MPSETVIITIGNANVAVNLSSTFTLSNLEVALRNNSTYNGNLDVVATNLAKLIGFSVLAIPRKEFKYQIFPYYDTYSWSWKVRVLNSETKNVYDGPLAGFSKAIENTDWTSYVGKVVRFNYEAGSEPNASRLVKVREYVKSNNTIATIDLDKEQPRNFNVGHIKNLKVVAN